MDGSFNSAKAVTPSDIKGLVAANAVEEMLTRHTGESPSSQSIFNNPCASGVKIIKVKELPVRNYLPLNVLGHRERTVCL